MRGRAGPGRRRAPEGGAFARAAVRNGLRHAPCQPPRSYGLACIVHQGAREITRKCGVPAPPRRASYEARVFAADARSVHDAFGRAMFVHDAFGRGAFVHDALGRCALVHDALGRCPFVHDAVGLGESVHDAAAAPAGRSTAREATTTAAAAAFRSDVRTC